MPVVKDTTLSVSALVEMIERDEIRLPEMQRDYVWTDVKVRDLLDSLYREYPSGTILTWETDKDVVTREFAVAQKKKDRKFELLLDGQQRLTSLSAILRGEPIRVKNRANPIYILFNLEHPDKPEETLEVSEYDADTEIDANGKDKEATEDLMTFVVSHPRFATRKHWIPVSEVFKTEDDAPFLKKAGVTSLDDPRFEKYKNRLKKLRDIKGYPYRIQILGRENSYAEVTDIFVRVNSGGVKLDKADLALAQITAKWPGSLKIFQEFQEECKTKGFDLPMAIHIRNLVAFATNKAFFSNVGKLSRAQLQEAWKKAKQGMDDALVFLGKNHVDNLTLLSSPLIIISVAFFRHLYKEKKGSTLSPEMKKQLAYWTHTANIKRRYSGSSETVLNQDLQSADKHDIEQMLARVEAQAGSLKISPVELEGRNNRSAYYKSMFMAFSHDGACDWHTHPEKTIKEIQEVAKIESHHIFPRTLLQQAGHSRAEIDDICNLAFISAGTNKWISNRHPADYLREYVTDDSSESELEKQCIPTDREFWELPNYKNFLKERRERVAKRLNEFLEGIKEG